MNKINTIRKKISQSKSEFIQRKNSAVKFLKLRAQRFSECVEKISVRFDEK